jgi:hypothetical protein
MDVLLIRKSETHLADIWETVPSIFCRKEQGYPLPLLHVASHIRQHYHTPLVNIKHSSKLIKFNKISRISKILSVKYLFPSKSYKI